MSIDWLEDSTDLVAELEGADSEKPHARCDLKGDAASGPVFLSAMLPPRARAVQRC
jgi:hypothetical protein